MIGTRLSLSILLLWLRIRKLSSILLRPSKAVLPDQHIWWLLLIVNCLFIILNDNIFLVSDAVILIEFVYLFILLCSVKETLSVCFHGISHELHLGFVFLEYHLFHLGFAFVFFLIVFVVLGVCMILVLIYHISIIMHRTWHIWTLIIFYIISFSFNLIIVLVICLDAFLKIIYIYKIFTLTVIIIVIIIIWLLKLGWC